MAKFNILLVTKDAQSVALSMDGTIAAVTKRVQDMVKRNPTTVRVFVAAPEVDYDGPLEMRVVRGKLDILGGK
jgi:hypothetical protein